MNNKYIPVTEFDTKVFMEPIKDKVTHIERKVDDCNWLRVTFTGWINKGKFEIEFQDGTKKYIDLQRVLK